MQELESKKKQQKALLSTELPDLFLMFPPLPLSIHPSHTLVKGLFHAQLCDLWKLNCKEE